MMHTTNTFTKRSLKAQGIEGVITGTCLVHYGDTQLPEASRRTRRALRRRRYA